MMDNYKTMLELEEKEGKNAVDMLNRFYFDNIIIPYKVSEKVIDMHTHTNYSDGDLSPYVPETIAKLIKEKYNY